MAILWIDNNVYYILNGKYYDAEKNLLMDRTELEKSFDIVRELMMPQRVNEMLQKCFLIYAIYKYMLNKEKVPENQTLQEPIYYCN